MAPRKPKPAEPGFPPLTCAACRHCFGDKDEWECWGDLPKPEAEPGKHNRGEPIDPNWPVCYFFIARENG